MRDRSELIRELSGGLEPTRASPAPARLAALWVLGAVAFCAAAIGVSGPFRPEWLAQLLSVPQFGLETGLGLVAIATVALFAFELGQPGAPGIARKQRWACAALGAWLVMVALGLVHPALQADISSYRPYCYAEVLGYGVLLAAVGILALRWLAPLERAWSGFVTGAMAGAIPALVMQLGCIYDPLHNLAWHLAPVFAVALLGACLGKLLLREI